MTYFRKGCALTAAYCAAFTFVLYGAIVNLKKRMQVIPDGSLIYNVQSIELEQKRRQQRVANVCSRLKRSINYSGWTSKSDRKHNLIYCPIPKAGWSSWKRLLFYINGVINDTSEEIGITSDTRAGIQELYVWEVRRLQMERDNRQYNFVFVRDPWRKLVSAYINKVIDSNYSRALHTPCEWTAMASQERPLTFAQFLTCIAEKADTPYRLDMHWKPMWTLCGFCGIHYDFIGHMETVNHEANYIIEHNSLNVTFPSVFSSKAYRIDDVIADWYASVPLRVIEKMRTLYELDFLLHGYSDVPPGWEGKLQNRVDSGTSDLLSVLPGRRPIR